MTVKDIGPAEEGPAMIEYLHKLLGVEHAVSLDLAGVWRHRKKDGTLIDVEIKWSPISFKGRAASLTMANAYPGLYDGLIEACTMPDHDDDIALAH